MTGDTHKTMWPGLLMGFFAAVVTPITLFMASFGAVCIPITYASYTTLNCFVAFIVGFGTGCSMSDGTYKIDPDKVKKMDANTERKRRWGEIFRMCSH